MAEGAAPLVFIAVAFLLAGFIKGAIGVGLPTVVMGLLSIVMPPAQAAALMVLPAIATNIWQMAAGPAKKTASAASRIFMRPCPSRGTPLPCP